MSKKDSLLCTIPSLISRLLNRNELLHTAFPSRRILGKHGLQPIQWQKNNGPVCEESRRCKVRQSHLPNQSLLRSPLVLDMGD